METNYKTKELLDRYNEKERSIAGIWETIGRKCPMVVRSFDQGEDAAILVTQVCKGIPYGYPLLKGKREYCDWYNEENAGSVRVPEGTASIWRLVDLPYDELDKILFRMDLNGDLNADGREAAVAQAAAPAPAPAVKARPFTGGLFGNDPAFNAPAQPQKPAEAPKAPRMAARPSAAQAEDESGIDGSVVMPFGKYKGLTVADVQKKDPGYIAWALENISAFRDMVSKRRAA